MGDFRVDYLYEAQKCLRHVVKQDPSQPQFWANLLGAIANATVASVPESVMAGVLEREKRHQAASEHIKERLRGDNQEGRHGLDVRVAAAKAAVAASERTGRPVDPRVAEIAKRC